MGATIFQRIGLRFQALPSRPIVGDRGLLLLGTFKKIGWENSVRQGAPVDRVGAPLPWWTYAAIHFIERAIDGTELVFEYGSGQSTKWLADRTRRVHSVEHDELWVAKVSQDLPPNADLLYRECSGDNLLAPAGDGYVSAIAEVDKPDIIIIDGRARLSCVHAACNVATGDELIILDDSHRPAYEPALEQLRQSGFARVDFVGPVPGRSNFSTTSVFFKSAERWARPSAAPTNWDNA